MDRFGGKEMRNNTALILSDCLPSKFQYSKIKVIPIKENNPTKVHWKENNSGEFKTVIVRK